MNVFGFNQARLLNLGLLCLVLLFQAVYPAKAAAKDLKVYFATTRLNEGPTNLPIYGGQRHLDLGAGSLEYGYSSVNCPRGLLTLGSQLDPKAYKAGLKTNRNLFEQAKIASPRPYTEAEFFEQIKNFNGQICLYLHGYDISFDESLRDFALLCEEYERRSGNSSNRSNSSGSEKFLPILFSWPSTGNKADYAADESNMSWSKQSFDRFFSKLIATKSAQSKLDVVAHSMGNRLLFSYFTARGSTDSFPVRNLYLASGDIDFHTAEQDIRDLERVVSGGVYVFVSDRDGPLILSHNLHGQPRLGRPIDAPKFGRQKADFSSSNYWSLLARDAAVLLLTKNGLNDGAETVQWLRQNPALERDLGQRSKFVDVSDVVNEDLGHGLPWSIIAGLMLEPETTAPLNTRIVHKRPDQLTLRQNGGKPKALYKFLKIDLD